MPGIGRSRPRRNEGSFSNYTFETWLESSRGRAHQKQPHDDWIRSVNFEIQVPRVIRLLRYDRLPRQGIHLNRRNVLARDGHQCQYCGRHFAIHQLSLDHVTPRSRGGPTTWENIVCAVPGMQREERRPDPPRSEDETRSPAIETKAQPIAGPEVGKPEVRGLANLARRGPMGGRGERLIPRLLAAVQRPRIAPCILTFSCVKSIYNRGLPRMGPHAP